MDYRAWLSYDEMVNTLYDASIGIIVPHPIERYKTNYPVKLFEYMAVGMPGLALAHRGAASEAGEEDGRGIVVEPYDVEAIKNAITKLLNERRLGTDNVPQDGSIERFSAANAAERLDRLFQNL